MPGEFFDNWSTQLRKGMLELGILNAVQSNRLYGYDIAKRMRDIDGLVVSEGTIYPILSRLKREGLVATQLEESSEGPARKYYHLTARGKTRIKQMNAHWTAVRDGIESLRNEDTP
jgi:PadR family transcriptional regulator PadR